jgi:hypothetical protein
MLGRLIDHMKAQDGVRFSTLAGAARRRQPML